MGMPLSINPGWPVTGAAIPFDETAIPIGARSWFLLGTYSAFSGRAGAASAIPAQKARMAAARAGVSFIMVTKFEFKITFNV
jgi:hypothetical protein